MKTYTLEEITDQLIGGKGSPERDAFEAELKAELLGYAVRRMRLKRKLTQSQLGELAGVQRSQISKLENNVSHVTLDTLLRVFKALNAKISFQIESGDIDQHLNLVSEP